MFQRLVAALLTVLSVGTLLTAAHADTGWLNIVTVPSDAIVHAKIFINDKLVEKSIGYKLDEGEYRIRVVSSDGGPKEYYGEESVLLRANSLKTVSLVLKKRPSVSFHANLKAKYGGRAIEPQMVALSAGRFTMGSPSGEPQRNSDEGPQHTVNVPAFEMAKYETTFDEWDACFADDGCSHWPEDEGWGRGKRPVINVSWDNAQQYIAWLNKKTGKSYRLPSEAEWEYAARAGTTGRFNTGDCITTAQANFSGPEHANGCPVGDLRKQTLPVGSFAANAWGLYDMHGNVSEYTQDCWQGSYSGAPDDGSGRTDGNCRRRLVRGGGHSYSGNALRSAYRGSSNPDHLDDNSGFRLSRSR